jgi:hypothetical protein
VSRAREGQAEGTKRAISRQADLSTVIDEAKTASIQMVRFSSESAANQLR